MTANVSLQVEDAVFDSQKFLPPNESPDLFLNNDAVSTEFFSSQFFQESDLSGSEKYFCFTELIFIRFLKVATQFTDRPDLAELLE